MGTYSKQTFQGQDDLTAQKYKNYIDSLGATIITTSIEDDTLYIHVDNVLNIFFNFSSHIMGVQYQETTSELAYLYQLDSQTVTICFNDDMFYIQHSGDWSDGRRMIVIYEKADEKRFLTYAGAGTDSQDSHVWYSIQDLNFNCIEDGQTYKHSSRLKYTQSVDHIDYTIDNLYIGEDISDIIDPNFVSTSTVTADTVYSFANQNFYAVGANIMFPIDN